MTSSNSDQEEFWTRNAGPTWVAQEHDLDQLLSPVLDLVLENADLLQGHKVLDIGCGTGQSTLRAGAEVGHTGHVLGADISSTMMARAAQRAADLPQVGFALADAEVYPFAPAQFDRTISRFGVMFFTDTTAAFRNIARAMKPGGKISFATWGQTQANPWFTLPASIAKAELGAPPKTDPDAPGPFALRDGRSDECYGRGTKYTSYPARWCRPDRDAVDAGWPGKRYHEAFRRHPTGTRPYRSCHAQGVWRI